MRASVIEALDHLDRPIPQMLPCAHEEKAVMSAALID